MSRLKEFQREAWGLERLLFSVQLPPPRFRSNVFTAREQEIERAEAVLLDAPRNLLLSGLFGVGKTIFIQELLDGLEERYPEEVLVVRECLDSAESDLLTTILRGLAHVLKGEDTEAHQINQVLAGVELTSQASEKAGGTGELGVPGIFKVGGSGESAATETWARKVVPNASFQVRELVRNANGRYPDRRLIVAVDDLDKRDPATVRQSLVEARSALHTDCAFVLTGHPLGVLRNIYSTAGGIFDVQLDLKVLSADNMKLLMTNYLEAGRLESTPQRGLHPFTEEAAQTIISRSFGIPRLLNKICLHILLQAGELRRPEIDMDTLRECWRIEGEKLRQGMSEEMARLYEMLQEQTDGFDPSLVPDDIYERLGVDSHQALLAKFNAAVGTDFVIGVDREGQTRFLPQPLLELPPSTSGDDAENNAREAND